jgi:lipoprotein signal peptidase
LEDLEDWKTGRSKSTRIGVLVVGQKTFLIDEEKADLLGRHLLGYIVGFFWMQYISNTGVRFGMFMSIRKGILLILLTLLWMLFLPHMRCIQP